jgi:hypothetical protein
MKNLFIVLLASAVLIVPTSAGIAFVLEGSPVYNGFDYTWSYQANLNGGEGIGYGGTQSYFTVYDFAGFVAVGVLPAGWTATEQLVGLTPSTQSGIPDDPNILNITFSYNGTAVDGPQNPLVDLTLYSTLSAGNASGVYSYQTNGEDLNGGYTLVDQGQGQTTVPTATAPEPAASTLLGAGLIGLMALRHGGRVRSPRSH